MQRRELKGEIRALVSTELERRGFLAAFTERTGGLSSGAFASLNLGNETGDREDLPPRNLRLVSDALGVDEPTTLRQVHGTRVISVDGREPAGSPAAEGDALTTRAARVPLAVMVADCVPVALASEEEGAVSAVHVGWRGLAAGVLPAALDTFGDAGRIAASIGPSIGPCHYEVGEEVVERVARGTEGAAVVLSARPRPRLDLGRTAEAILRGLGVPRVERAEECTACLPDRFFSHRRDDVTGRQALVAIRL